MDRSYSALVIEHQVVIRLVSFFVIFLVMALFETLVPRRALRTSKASRWVSNLSITFLDALVSRLIFPVSAAGLAIWAGERGLGLFNYGAVGSFPAGVISIVFLDFIVYLQHLVFHKVRLFWPLHGMHHTDLDIDVTTGTRFHPLEIAISMLIKMGIVLLLGVPAWSFVVFEVFLNGTAMFNHSNVKINPAIDRVLRLVLVTPDMHRVHHSVIIREHDTNYGFNLPWWDRAFGTYKSQPEAGHDNMVIGLANFRDPAVLTLPGLLILPFTRWKKF
jgi:sterol desaturase/sphingolipid hydroxylase (fatty acid hydroxylase superfamily)